MTVKLIDSEEQLQQVFDIRKKVFVEEQGVPLADEFDEFDRLDGRCRHLVVHYQGEPAATGRIREATGYGKLERICVLKPFRKYGLGKSVVGALEEAARSQGWRKLKLHGQTHAAGFYEKLGYSIASPEFMEDGIPHYVMMKELGDAR
ncbi:GNAT family N-acetyltransferase [Paenibacillus tepidiphilus]|uniref:GNAT family N-acetyltransferase n=1 Tax=Paenibacillus tepidiphilus TaxID=2608683 RepID=UPI00123AFFA5|nr:GNAT family N-acetyltransferase [Paenibacillus tepidiphilus]